jgi:hypothetical protein
MGNRVVDYKEGIHYGRDRLKTQVEFTAPTGEYLSLNNGPVPSPTNFISSGSASRLLDVNHGVGFEKFLELKHGHKAFKHYDFGGPLVLERVHVSMPGPSFLGSVNLNSTTKRYFIGNLPPNSSYYTQMRNINQGKWPSIPDTLGIDRLSLWGLGSTAIAKSLPDVPEFSLFRFVGELRAGLPQIPLAALAKERKLRNVGGEYLNVQFGILPTISDTQKFIKQLMSPALRSSIAQVIDKEHRVRKVLDKGTITTTVPVTGTQLISSSSSGYSLATGSETNVKSFRIWSSCSFVYQQATMLDQLLKDLDKQLGGMGAVPTLIDFWNLLPWSWLADWFVNFNHVITNLSYLGRDGLRMQRGYIMATYSDVLTSTQTRKNWYGAASHTVTGVRTFERKYRVRASPFGFGYTWKDFDPFQLSILSALGISRMRF